MLAYNRRSADAPTLGVALTFGARSRGTESPRALAAPQGSDLQCSPRIRRTDRRSTTVTSTFCPSAKTLCELAAEQIKCSSLYLAWAATIGSRG